MRPPITLLDRFQQAGAILIGAAIVFWVGWELLHVIGKSSPSHRRRGKFVLGWMFGGWLVGGMYGVCIIDNLRFYPNEADTGLAALGMLIGWPVGMIHGSIMLAIRPHSHNEPTPSTDLP